MSNLLLPWKRSESGKGNYGTCYVIVSDVTGRMVCRIEGEYLAQANSRADLIMLAAQLADNVEEQANSSEEIA